MKKKAVLIILILAIALAFSSSIFAGSNVRLTDFYRIYVECGTKHTAHMVTLLNPSGELPTNANCSAMAVTLMSGSQHYRYPTGYYQSTTWQANYTCLPHEFMTRAQTYGMGILLNAYP